DELASGIQEIGEQRIEGVVPARAVAVHDDDLRRACRLRTAHGGVDLLGVETARLVVERAVLATGLRPLDDACDAFDVADHVDAHGGRLLSHRWKRDLQTRASSSPARLA